MIALDTNLLVYANAAAPIRNLRHRHQHPHLSRAIASAGSTAPDRYLDEKPQCGATGERPGYWDQAHRIIEAASIRGAQVHDARIAALCLFHGVAELWTADRDFQRFPNLKTRNPLVQPPT